VLSASRSAEVAFLLVVAGLLSFQLFVPPIAGLANNGDFSRVVEPLGIFPPEELGAAAYFGWVVPEYRFDANRVWLRGLCCYSSSTLLAIPAVPVGLLISPSGRIDLRAIGIVNLLGFLGATGLLVVASRALRPLPRFAAGLLFVLAFTDVSYATYFNSFYTEPATLIFFLASLALVLLLAERPAPSPWLFAAFLLCAALLSTSRPQNALLGILFALLGLRIAWWSLHPSRRAPAVAAALAVCALSVAYPRGTPGPLRQTYLYGAVFRELLAGSPDPRRDLADLGLSPELERFVGVSGFSPDSPVRDPAFQRAFYGRIGYSDLAKFYLQHPERLRTSIGRIAAHAFDIRPVGIGNYAPSAGKPRGARSGSFDLWSRARSRILPARAWFVVGFLAVNLAAAIALRIRARDRATAGAAEIWILVVFVAAFQFSVSAMMEHESRRSLFLFNAACDLLFFALCAGAVSVGAKLRAPDR
jgi:hypothetical protein